MDAATYTTDETTEEISSSAGRTRVDAEEARERSTAWSDAEPEHETSAEALRSARETFSDWFGSADATLVSMCGELGPSRVEGLREEIYVGGRPLSDALDEETLPFYRDVFLRTLFDERRAGWPGSETDGGTIHDGVVVELARDGVRITFGRRAENGDSLRSTLADETSLPPDDHVTLEEEAEIVDLERHL